MKSISVKLPVILVCISIYSCKNRKNKESIQNEITVIKSSNNKATSTFKISGSLNVKENTVENSLIRVIDETNDSIYAELKDSDRFGFDFKFDKKYSIKFSKANYHTKKVLVDTNIPDTIDCNLPPLTFVVTLFPVDSLSNEVVNETVGRVFYNSEIDNFDTEIFFN